LIDYDPFGYETQSDPYPAYRALLEHHPVYRNERRGFYALSRYDDVQRAFRDWHTFSSAGGVTVDDLLEIMGPSFLTMDPPRHELLRDIVREVFRPRAVAALEPSVTAHAERILDACAEREEESVDLAAELARRLPVLVICELMGFPLDDERMLKSWSDAILERVPDDDSTPQEARAAAAAMRGYFEEQLAARRVHSGGDLPSLLVHARVDGEPLPHDELVGLCFLLFEAGNSTTTSLIGNSVLLLARYPQERARLAATPGAAPRAVEELLRFESPVQNMGRIASTDVSLHGETIEAGARVLLVIGAANRDPRVFDDPDRLDLSREPKRHAAFGDGIHHCIGAPLARLEGRVALTSLLARFPAYEVTEYERFHDVTQRNVKRLVVRLSP
jgi:cytochrome P450